MLLPALAMLLPCAAAFCLFAAFWNGRPLRDDLGLKVALATGTGIGLSSLTFFAALVIGGNRLGATAAADILLIAAAVGLAVWRGRRAAEAVTRLPAEAKETRLVPLALTLGFALAAAHLLIALANEPHGWWDAWMIWNMRARTLFRCGADWPWAFSQAFLVNGTVVHLDYPLLLPGAVARGWQYAGGETTLIPSAISALFTLGTAALLYLGLAGPGRRAPALVATILLTTTPVFITQGAGQCADVPMAFFILATVVLFYRAEAAPSPNDLAKAGTNPDKINLSRNGLFALAGLTAGLAAWTKNEGLVLVVAVVLGRLLAAARARDWRGWFGEMVWFAGGLLPGIAALLHFKLTLAPPSEILGAVQGPGALAKALDAGRHALVAWTFLQQAFFFGGWHALLPWATATPVAVLWLILAHPRPEALRSRWFATACVILATMLAAYYASFIVSPYDLKWHIGTSVHRLFLQLWPTLLFAVFAAARNPLQPAGSKGAP